MENLWNTRMVKIKNYPEALDEETVEEYFR